METPHTIFFVGKPGSGKGTQAKLLVEKTGWKFMSPGDWFRMMRTQDTSAGRKIRETYDAGLLQPPWLAQYVFLNSIFPLKEEDGAVFEGAGRTVPEAHFIVEALTWIGRPFKIFHLIVPDDEVRRRIELRKTIEKRTDEDVVDERLKEYQKHTDPAIEVLRSSGQLVDLDGHRTREEIAAEVREILGIQ